MKKLLFAVVLLCILISCDSEDVQNVTEYSTPTIKGVITIPDGSEVTPEEVYVKVIDSNGKTNTIKKVNSDGTFVVQNLSEEVSYNILFTSEEPEFNNRSLDSKVISKGSTKNGVGGWLKDVVPAVKEGNDIGSVKMKPLGTIKGKALIDGATEHYDITIYIPGTSYSAITDKDGSFAIYNVPEGTYTLRYILDDHVPVMMDKVMLVCPETSENPEKVVKDVTLFSNKGTVEGKAVLGDSSDSTGITIKLESEDKALSYTGSTSADGYYVINNVEPGKYRILASYASYLTQTSDYFEVVEASTTTVSERLELFENIGTVVGSASLSDSDVKEGIQILIKNVAGTNSYSVLTDASGAFTKMVTPGDYTVLASYPGYMSQSVAMSVVENSTNKITMPALTPSTGAVAGFVVLEGVTDCSGVTITLTDSADKTNVLAEISAADGSFRITGIKKSGTYLLTYSKNGYVTNLSNSIDVTVGSVATVSSVTLKSIMSTISGKIQLEGASSHENTTILLKNETNQYTATTDQKGEYKINRVLPGTYTLMASKDGYVTASTNEFVVESSTEKEVELLSLSVAIRSIVGKVTLELGSDYAGALVTATNLSDSTLVYSAISNSAGDYTLAGMKPGEYQIVISYTGYRTETLPTVNVVSSTVTTIAETKMNINRGTITGVAKLEGRSNSEGIKVELLRGSSVYETTTTDESGNYSLYVPQGNYTGVRYSYTDYASTSISKDIALFADNYVSMGNETLTATHNSVYGTVDVLTTDDESAVTISFDNVTSIEKVVTEAGGSFQFDHVPVGSYTLRFQRQDCSDITIPVEIIASDGINLGKIEVTPNTATIKGKVNLNNETSLANVKISVDLGDGKTLETYTDNSGRYEIGGISIADEYTVSYSKEGWDTSTQQISPKLNILEIRELDEITLLDTTAPILSSVIINSGANTTANKNVTLNLTASDIGSGLDKIMVTYDNVFDKGTRQYDYSAIFNWELPAENGVKTIYVRVVDRAGNESASYTTSVTLTNQKTEVSGTMLDENLTWTKEKSPYLVSGTVVVKKGTTLTIEPGVDVQFAGNYGITVEGTIKAIGTETEKISFYGIGEGENNWLGINGRNDNLSMLKYVDIQGTTKGLQGKMTVFDSKINTNQFALYNFSGEINDSDVNGNVYTNCGTLLNNRIILASLETSFTDSLLTGNVISGNNEQVLFEGVGENNSFTNLTINMTAGIKNCTFANCTVNFNEGSYYSCVFDGCSFGNFKPAIIRDSNFINFDTINISSSVYTYEEFDLTSNFWGYVNTRELDERGVERVHSFMVDYFSDSESSITKGNIANYRSVPNDEAGYKGSSYYSYPSESTIEYKIGDDGPAGGKVFYDKGYYSNGWRYLECSIEKITNGQYFGYYRSTNSSVNMVLGTSGIIGSGKLNTEIFYLGMGEEAFITESVALKSSEYGAKACSKYVYGGYDDWFMPSKNEINLIFMNRSILALSILDYGTYWASSERSAEQGWEQVMDNGSQWCWPDRHTTGHDIIAIRAF